jgi:hypothetical protein
VLATSLLKFYFALPSDARNVKEEITWLWPVAMQQVNKKYSQYVSIAAN